MTAPSPLVRGLLLLVLVASTAEAAPRRGGWYWWWVRQQAPTSELDAAVSTPDPALQVTTASVPVTTQPEAPVAPVTTASLFASAASPVSSWSGYPILDSSAYAYAPTSAVPSYAYDALINFGSAPYASASALTTGGAQSWVNSPVVQ